MCLYPRIIRNKKYTANKKNGGVIPTVNDIRVLAVPVGCGKCIECVKQEQRKWQVRLLEEIKDSKNGKFITLTFSNESIIKLERIVNKGKKKLEGYELDNEIAKVAVRRFLERHRKKNKRALRHWLVTELGHHGTENIHLHGIIWGLDSREELEKLWKYGYIFPRTDKQWQESYVNETTINYITKYIGKQDKDHQYYKPKVLTSAGMGRGYTLRKDSKKNKFNGTKTDETYRTKTGHKIALPVYWRNKLYTDDEREKLWLQKLDKQERWVMGERIKVDKDDKEYYKTLAYYRRKNKKLGYGDDSVNWNRKQYENERRKLMMAQRKGGKGVV